MTKTQKIKKEVDKEEKNERPFVLEEKLLSMEDKENSHLDIIATFIREKVIIVENSKQLSNIIGRFGKVASKMSGAYNNNQIYGAIERIKNDNAARSRSGQDEIDWTLDTVFKYLTK